MAVTTAHKAVAQTTPLGGFIPFVGLTLTDDYQTATTSAVFFIAEPRNSPAGSFLGSDSSGSFDLALLDTGAATHIITEEARALFDIDGENFDGENYQTVGGATGFVSMEITDPLGVHAGGFSRRNSSSTSLDLNTQGLRGQGSTAILSAPSDWTLPNILGLPMAAQHKVSILNSSPQIFQLDGRTVRTPDVRFGRLGTGGDGILRRTELNITPGLSFVQGPLYVQNLDFISLELHENPLSPSVIESGGLYIDVDMTHDADGLEDTTFLFDTGADLTVISQQTAARLGFDPILDTPDFILQVEGSGGVTAGVPGLYLDELQLDTVGGSFTMTNVPVAVLDVTNPSDPGNIVPGILGTQVFNGRDLVIDANPSIGAGGAGPSLYISDPVSASHVWGTTAVSGNWTTANSWNAPGVPTELWDTRVANVRGSNQTAVVSTDSTVFRATVTGTANAEMAVRVTGSGNLTLFADMLIEQGGRLHMEGGRVDAAFIQLDGGSLTGSGDIYVGNGPLSGSVRNVSGTVAPGDPNGNAIGLLSIEGDIVNDAEGTLAFDLAGTSNTLYDRITADRFAFVNGELDVSLTGGFTPSIGDSFTLISVGESVFGAFSDMSLPSAFTWDVDYNTSGIVLRVTGMGFNGDFNNDGELDCTDIDMLVRAVSSGSTSSSWDANSDGSVNAGDVTEWIEEIYGTLMGDANLDGVVDGQDFLVWNLHKFEASDGWCVGDFNADGVVDGMDFLTWNQNKFQSAASNVPEPSCLAGLVLACSMLVAGRRRAHG